MIPYFGLDAIPLYGPIALKTWGTLVALGFGVGTWVAYRRAQARKLDPSHILSLAGWIFFAAMVGSRVFHVLVYEPGYYALHPWQAIDPRLPGYAITGGFLGAAGAFFAYVKRNKIDWLAYADTLAWGLPWGCGIGRIGCFLIHDHPGTLSHSLLAVRYPDGEGRHDLGLYLSLVGFGTGILFLLLRRKPRPPGFWLACFLSIEGLSRIFLDFLRVVDVRYLGLTPAQWVGIGFFALGAGWIWRLRTVRPQEGSDS